MVGLQHHVILRQTKGWLTCKFKSSEEWPKKVDRIILNKSMRHMEDADNIDSMMKP